MGILGVLRTFLRYWWITVPILLLTLGGAVYVAMYAPRTYETTSSYVLLNPPNPTNGNASQDNPFLRLADPSSMVALLASILNDEQTIERLEARGADGRYEAGAGSGLGGASLILQIDALGKSPEKALQTAKLVGDELQEQLALLQRGQSVPKSSRITLLELNPVPTAKLKASSLLRAMIAVMALGTILLVVLVSAAQAISEIRRERRDVREEEARGQDRDERRAATPGEDATGSRDPLAGLGPAKGWRSGYSDPPGP